MFRKLSLLEERKKWEPASVKEIKSEQVALGWSGELGYVVVCGPVFASSELRAGRGSKMRRLGAFDSRGRGGALSGAGSCPRGWGGGA